MRTLGRISTLSHSEDFVKGLQFLKADGEEIGWGWGGGGGSMCSEPRG